MIIQDNSVFFCFRKSHQDYFAFKMSEFRFFLQSNQILLTKDCPCGTDHPVYLDVGPFVS